MHRDMPNNLLYETLERKAQSTVPNRKPPVSQETPATVMTTITAGNVSILMAK